MKGKENYSNGEMDGQWTWWRPNGIKDREGNYKSGVKHGLWVSWNDNDHKKGEETYVNGVLDGLVTVWHDNGNKDSCLLYTSPSPRDKRQSRMPSSA